MQPYNVLSVRELRRRRRNKFCSADSNDSGVRGKRVRERMLSFLFSYLCRSFFFTVGTLFGFGGGLDLFDTFLKFYLEGFL